MSSELRLRQYSVDAQEATSALGTPSRTASGPAKRSRCARQAQLAARSTGRSRPARVSRQLKACRGPVTAAAIRTLLRGRIVPRCTTGRSRTRKQDDHLGGRQRPSRAISSHSEPVSAFGDRRLRRESARPAPIGERRHRGRAQGTAELESETLSDLTLIDFALFARDGGGQLRRQQSVVGRRAAGLRMVSVLAQPGVPGGALPRSRSACVSAITAFSSQPSVARFSKLTADG